MVYTIQLEDGTVVGEADDLGLAGALASGLLAGAGVPACLVVDDAGKVVGRTGIERDETDFVLDSLSPNTAEVGGEPVTMHVLGSGFQRTATIIFNGGAEPTTWISSSELTTIVEPATASGGITVTVHVENGDERVSNSLDFSFTNPPEPPPE